MLKQIASLLLKLIIGGFILGVLFIIIALIISNFTNFQLNDVLFIEGIVIVILAISSTFSGNPMGLSLQGLGQINAQYIANANLEVTRMEHNKEMPNKKLSPKALFNSWSLILAGLLCILLNFML